MPGPNATTVTTPQGLPPDALKSLLGEFKANAGKLPQVNPPQAAAVLAGPTALEVAGHPEPEKPPEEKVAPVPKPAEVVAAEQAGKTRRTAAVVQVELDAALKKIGELEYEVETIKLGARNLEGQLQAQADSVAQAAAGGEDQATLIEAVEMIKSLQAQLADRDTMVVDLRAEASTQLDDNRKAWARVAQLEEQLEGVATGEHPAPEQVTGYVTLADTLTSLINFLPAGATLQLTGRS